MVGLFNVTPTEMILVLVVAVLLFGGRLPQVARSIARSVMEFRRGLQDLRSRTGIEDEIRRLRQEVEMPDELRDPRRLLDPQLLDPGAEAGEAGKEEGQGAEEREDAAGETDARGAPAVQPPPGPSPFQKALEETPRDPS